MKVNTLPKPVKIKKVTKKQLKCEWDKLDRDCLKLVGKCSVARDGTCRNCNSAYRLTGHHIRVKQHHATRYLLDNLITLCWKCHSKQKFQPEQFNDMIIDIIGQGYYNEMKWKSQRIVDWTVEDLKDIKASLTAKLRELKS